MTLRKEVVDLSGICVKILPVRDADHNFDRVVIGCEFRYQFSGLVLLRCHHGIGIVGGLR